MVTYSMLMGKSMKAPLVKIRWMELANRNGLMADHTMASSRTRIKKVMGSMIGVMAVNIGAGGLKTSSMVLAFIKTTHRRLSSMGYGKWVNV